MSRGDGKIVHLSGEAGRGVNFANIIPPLQANTAGLVRTILSSKTRNDIEVIQVPPTDEPGMELGRTDFVAFASRISVEALVDYTAFELTDLGFQVVRAPVSTISQ